MIVFTCLVLVAAAALYSLLVGLTSASTKDVERAGYRLEAVEERLAKRLDELEARGQKRLTKEEILKKVPAWAVQHGYTGSYSYNLYPFISLETAEGVFGKEHAKALITWNALVKSGRNGLYQVVGCSK